MKKSKKPSNNKLSPTVRSNLIISNLNHFVKPTLCLTLVFILSTPFSSTPTLALTEDEVEKFSQNSIIFVDPSACTPLSTTGNGDSEAAHGLTSQQTAFVERWYSTAQQLSVQYGIPWEAVVAQGILESAAGTSNFAVQRNNFFGIGAFDSNPNNAFSYATPEEGWEGYYRNIKRTPTYRNNGVFQGETITSPLAYIIAVKKAGYATDPNYVNKLEPIVASIESLSAERGWSSSAQLAQMHPEMLTNAAANAEGANLGSDSRFAVDNCGISTAISERDRPIGPIHEPSNNIPCDPRTKFIRIDNEGAIDGRFVSITLCEVPNLPSRNGGNAIVNSRISGATFALVEAAKQAGVSNIAVSSSYRSYQQQVALGCNNPNRDTNRVGSCNGSLHRSGLALDLYMPGCVYQSNSSGFSDAECKRGSNQLYDWLHYEDNVSKYGFTKLISEYWHIDARNFR